MKKLKTGLGLGVIAAAFLLALGTSQKASALKYWRFAPGQTLVNPSTDCGDPSSDICAVEYQDDNATPTGQVIRAIYLR